MRESHSFRRAVLTAALAVCLGAADGRECRAALSSGSPVEVRILYDNSGSMYPGYAPPGRPGRSRSESGARFFHQYPDFSVWLADFVARQSILNGDRVSMSAFTSWGTFSPSDIRQVHPRVPLASFDARRAVDAIPSPPGATTFLTETLHHFTRGFEGIVWLVTDNIVETRRGEPDVEVDRFFRALRDTRRYRSVHLFKYPFSEERAVPGAALAIYGIVVSEEDVDPSVLAYFDRKLRTDFRFANRRQGNPPPQLFPGREHLKLKDLSIDALELQTPPSLQVVIESSRRNLFTEKQMVRLVLEGEIRSFLTQHAVTAGTYTLQPDGPFVPEDWARQRLGAAELPAGSFRGSSGTVAEPIPPNGSRRTSLTLASTNPLSLGSGSLAGWLSTALGGAAVQYTGPVLMTFDGVKAHLERDRMAGIYGIERTSSVFDFQDVQEIPVAPSRTQVSFVLRTDSRRTWLFFAALLLLGLPLLFGFVALRRVARYRIEITGSPASIVALRRLQGHEVLLDGHRLGRLSRGLGGHRFDPAPPGGGVMVTPTRDPEVWEVKLRDRGYRLSIKPEVTAETPMRRGQGQPPPVPPRTAANPGLGPSSGGAAATGGPVARPRPTIRPPS